MSIFGANPIYRTTGVIDANNSSVTLDCKGAAGAIVTVVGAFTGTIESVGGTTSVDGGRLLFKSGVGSIGTNKIVGDNTSISREYRIIAGGDRYTMQAVGAITGSVTIEIISSNSTNTVFGNGPFHTSEEEAVRAGKAYIASIPETSLSSNDEIGYVLSNPANSGVNIFLTERLFGSDQDSAEQPLRYQAFSNPTIVANTNGVIGNRKVGGIASAATFMYQIGSNLVMGGIALSGEPIPTGGQVRERKLLAILAPNTKVGFKIRGAGNIVQAVTVFSTLQWYEESVN